MAYIDYTDKGHSGKLDDSGAAAYALFWHYELLDGALEVLGIE